MQLWFARRSEVSLRQQLVTQVILGVLSGDLPPGQRLPSTRELARRFRVHPNTISAGYRQLESERWVERRRGSGVYVCQSKPEAPLPASFALDQLIADLLRSARGLGLALPAVQSRLRQWLAMQPPDHFLLIEPDEELRRIVAHEMQQAVSFPVKSCGLQACQDTEGLAGAVPAALPNKAKAARDLLPAGTELLTLQVRSVPTSLAGWLPAPSGALIGVASSWPDFLKLARTILTAAGFQPEGLVFRDTRKPRWQRGLEQTAAVVCDSVTARDLPKGCKAIAFSLLAESCLAELRRYEEFVRTPLGPK
ncbi:MAG TPA: GntR family transcriptional regulator [Terriglobales bacterium]|nr:GntR family transcriptional regulator [Terriglobales bacterium]